MKSFIKVSLCILAVAFGFGFSGPIVANAATAPSLGAADGYSVFGKAGVTNTGAGTHVWGNAGADASVGLISSQVSGSIVANGDTAGVATAASAAYDTLDLGSQGTPAALDLAGNNTVVPGVYTVGATTLNGTLTLNGAGVYIFRSSSSISTSGAGTMSLINGATACNVFWEIPASMTIGTNAHIEGTIIAKTGLISLATGATLKGRAISLISQVTLDSNQITQPTCAATGGSASFTGTINVVKTVINDNGGSKTVVDFPLFINGTPIVSGVTNTFTVNSTTKYIVTENTDPSYTRTFSGDCDSNGVLYLKLDEKAFCIITNNDIGTPVAIAPAPPIISVVKVPSPLSLPAGPGAVKYTYTLRNIGTVPMTGITMVGDTCSPIALISGDSNFNAKLDLTETWVYTCSTTLSETHTNTVVATGWANGISATDIASATVVVGTSIVPPLIHVTKIPNPLTLPAGGGAVTYTDKVTNPGTVALNNVKVVDDKCASVTYVSGDANNNSKLESEEIWTYVCESDLKVTTTNTVTASADANGITARDFAIAHVVVANAAPVVVPALPNAGIPPEEKSSPWNIILSGIFIITAVSMVLVLKKRMI